MAKRSTRRRSKKDGDPLDSRRLTPEQLAHLLTAAGRRTVTVDEVERVLQRGVPRNPDGTINLACYGAWLVREVLRGARLD